MITVNNTTLRNLQEQVLENKQKIAQHFSVDRVLADFGIRIVGRLASPGNLPGSTEEYPLPAAPNYTGQYGDGYMVGIAPNYQYWIYTRPDSNSGYITGYWLNIGRLNIVGPQGPQGEQGEQGEKGTRGSIWFNSQTFPPQYRANLDDKCIIVGSAGGYADGDIYTFTANGVWELVGNIKGPTGATGLQGPKGEKGDQGPQGPQGIAGANGQSFHVEGIVPNTDLLPEPTQEIRAGAWLVGDTPGNFDMWIIVGGHEEGDALTWFNVGKVASIQGPQGPEGPQGLAGKDGVEITDISEVSTTSSGSQTRTTVRVSLSDGSTQEFIVFAHNGEKGEKGDPGEQGPAGPEGTQGPQGEAGPSINRIEQISIGSDEEYTQTSLKAIMSNGEEIPFSVAAKNGQLPGFEVVYYEVSDEVTNPQIYIPDKNTIYIPNVKDNKSQWIVTFRQQGSSRYKNLSGVSGIIIILIPELGPSYAKIIGQCYDTIMYAVMDSSSGSAFSVQVPFSNVIYQQQKSLVSKSYAFAYDNRENLTTAYNIDASTYTKYTGTIISPDRPKEGTFPDGVNPTDFSVINFGDSMIQLGIANDDVYIRSTSTSATNMNGVPWKCLTRTPTVVDGNIDEAPPTADPDYIDKYGLIKQYIRTDDVDDPAIEGTYPGPLSRYYTVSLYKDAIGWYQEAIKSPTTAEGIITYTRRWNSSNSTWSNWQQVHVEAVLPPDTSNAISRSQPFVSNAAAIVDNKVQYAGTVRAATGEDKSWYIEVPVGDSDTIHRNRVVTSLNEGYLTYDLSDSVKAKLNLVDSDTITVMHDSTETQLNLAADVLADVNKSLKLPVSAPAETKLVGINTSNSQVSLGPGKGIGIDADSINLRTNSGSPSGIYFNPGDQSAYAGWAKIDEVQVNISTEAVIQLDYYQSSMYMIKIQVPAEIGTSQFTAIFDINDINADAYSIGFYDGNMVVAQIINIGYGHVTITFRELSTYRVINVTGQSTVTAYAMPYINY